MLQGSTQIGFQAIVGTLFSQYLLHSTGKLISISSYDQNIIYQISTSYLKRFFKISRPQELFSIAVHIQVVKGNYFVIN